MIFAACITPPVRHLSVTGEETPGESGYSKHRRLNAHGNQTDFLRTQHSHLLNQWEKLSLCKHMLGINHEL